MTANDLALNVMRRVNLADILLRAAARHPDHLVVVEGGRRLTYRDFDRWVNRLAAGLIACGYERGDALALMAENSAEFLATFFACARTGVVCVPINLAWGEVETRHVLNHARVRGVVADRDRLVQLALAAGPLAAALDVFAIGDGPKSGAVGGMIVRSFVDLEEGDGIAPVLCRVENEDAASYLYTSGTTSAPKGVINTHLASYITALGGAIDMVLSQHDRVAAMMPMFHTAQLYALCMPAFAAGATIYPLKGFNAAQLLDLVAEERVTVVFGLPMMYRELMTEQLERPRDVSSLRLGIYAMAAIGAEELGRLREVFGFGMALLFGQTELNPISAILKPEHHATHGGAMGIASINVQIAIKDEHGNDLGPGERGEIVYRSPQVLAGYLNDPEATAEACRDGWFHSGDAGYRDEHGVMWFTDRFKDIIKSGGENVSSQEVERAVYSADPAVAEVAVVGLPHSHWTEAVTAFVVIKPGGQFDEGRLMVDLRAGLSRFKCPKAVIVVEELPKTSTGKVRKHELRQQYSGHYDDKG